MSKTVTFELSEDQAEFLEATAEREERSVDEVVGDLVKQQMGYDAWFKQEVQEGLGQLDRGEFLTHEEVGTRLAELKAELLAKHGGQ